MRWQFLRTVLLAAAAGTALTGAAWAQPPGETPARPADGENNKKSMILLLKTEPNINLEDFKTQLENSITLANCTCTNLKNLEPVPISQIEYEAIDRFIKGYKPGQLTAPKSAVRSRLITIDKPVLIVSKEDVTDELKKLVVDYHNGTTKEYTPEPPEKVGAKLIFLNAKDYQLELEPNDIPKAFKATFVDKSGNEKPLEEKLQAKRYFYLTLTDFEGKLEDLSAAFRSDQWVNKASFMPTTRQTFVLADFSEDPPTMWKPLINEQSITLFIEQPRERDATRVWLKFPLTEQQAKEELAKCRTHGQFGLPKAIADSGATVKTGVPVMLESKDSAKWYELTKEPGAFVFTRQLGIKDAPAMRTAFEDVYYLVMWEYDPAPQPNKPKVPVQAVGVIDQGTPGPDGKPAEPIKTYVVMRKVEGWRDGLTRPATPSPGSSGAGKTVPKKD
jgi:hypothetical protein